MKGNVIADHGSSEVNLFIPERYLIARQTLLESPWSAFEPTSGYVQDILINIGGFVPFGFTLSAFLLATGWTKRTTVLVVLTGFLVSLTIETLQVFLPTRDSDFTDVLTDTLGMWIGASLHRRWLPSWLRLFTWMRIADRPM
jgi:glycopeptide antibiotics resistance protein